MILGLIVLNITVQIGILVNRLTMVNVKKYDCAAF